MKNLGRKVFRKRLGWSFWVENWYESCPFSGDHLLRKVLRLDLC